MFSFKYSESLKRVSDEANGEKPTVYESFFEKDSSSEGAF